MKTKNKYKKRWITQQEEKPYYHDDGINEWMYLPSQGWQIWRENHWEKSLFTPAQLNTTK